MDFVNKIPRNRKKYQTLLLRDHQHCQNVRNNTVVTTNDECVKYSIPAILVIKLWMKEGDDLNKYLI